MSNNSISDVGAVALAEAIHHNSTLEALILSKNNISNAGAVALARALHHNSTLKSLHLYDNNALGKDGINQLVKALTVNTSITTKDQFHPIGGLRLPKRLMKYATQCTQYNTVKDRIHFG